MIFEILTIGGIAVFITWTIYGLPIIYIFGKIRGAG